MTKEWRRGRDSNPRYGFTPYNGLANPSRETCNPFDRPQNADVSGLKETRSQRKERRDAYLTKARESAQYDPRSGKPVKSLEEILNRFRVLPNGCHEWTGTRNKHGYGIVCIMIDGKATTVTAHRLQWMRCKGKIGPDKDACHDCPDGNDNRACINIDHLWDGTPRENIHDMMAKGRENFSGLLNYQGPAQDRAHPTRKET